MSYPCASFIYFLGKKVYHRYMGRYYTHPYSFYLKPLDPLPITDLFIASVFPDYLSASFWNSGEVCGTSGGSDIPIRLMNKYFKIPLSSGVYLVDGFVIVLGALTLGSSDTAIYAPYALISVYVLEGRRTDGDWVHL